MKSPAELAVSLARQWRDAATRERRLGDPAEWPISLAIGRPTPAQMQAETARVREHVAAWRAVDVGRVEWQPVNFRSAAGAVELPLRWCLESARDWVKASRNAEVQHEFLRIEALLRATEPAFHPLLIRQPRLWRERADDEVVQATRLALALAPGHAGGRPLRSLAIAGIDSKFFERHRALLIALLDLRFDGQVSELGLEYFLDALDEGEHWLLVAALAPGLLPFTQQRIRARELMTTPLPAGRILLVENERCLQRLPPLPDCIAILGAGLDLAWVAADWLRTRRLGYWGDMDTWGLSMLARVRNLQPQVERLLMEHTLFARHAATLAVIEPVPATETPPAGLLPDEQDFYRYLRGLEKGRIEQEFLPDGEVQTALHGWR